MTDTPNMPFGIEDKIKFFDYFRKETDRACAMLARALMEDQLARLFEAHFVAGASAGDLLKGYAPLATFSARIRVARALGLITGTEASDLDVIREIGNDFAHELDHEMSFDTQSIRDRTFNLQLAKLIIDHGDTKEEPISPADMEDMKTRPRRRFEVGVGVLWILLKTRTASARRATEPDSLILTKG